jgi:hypothetical protein
MHGDAGQQLGGGLTVVFPAPCWGCGENVAGSRQLSAVTVAAGAVVAAAVVASAADGLCAGCRRRWGSMGRHPSSLGHVGLPTTAFPLRAPSPTSGN